MKSIWRRAQLQIIRSVLDTMCIICDGMLIVKNIKTYTLQIIHCNTRNYKKNTPRKKINAGFLREVIHGEKIGNILFLFEEILNNRENGTHCILKESFSLARFHIRMQKPNSLKFLTVGHLIKGKRRIIN